VHNNIGLLLKQLGRLDEARDHLERSYRISVDFLGPDHGDVRMSAVNLGSVYELLGEYEAAVRQLEPVLGPPFTSASDEVAAKRLIAFAEDLRQVERGTDALAALDAAVEYAEQSDAAMHARVEFDRARVLAQLERSADATAACQRREDALASLAPEAAAAARSHFTRCPP
jgi:tetratricopeptide (TPR) repeat protein